MALRLLVILFYFILPTVSYSEILIMNNDIYTSGKKLNSDLHPDIVGSNLFDDGNVIVISNSYNASTTTKTEVNYFFDKFNEKLKRIEWISYSTEYERYYGYTINFFDGKKITDINNDYIDSLEDKFGFKDYSFEKISSKIMLILKLSNGTVKFNTYNNKTPIIVNYEINNDGNINEKYEICEFIGSKTSSIECKQIGFISFKSLLYSEPNLEKYSNMYLIKNDQVILLKKKTDNNGQKWYFINYKGKKDINMWIKAEAVELK